MDDLKINHTVSDPPSSGGGRRIFIIAIVIAAILHLIVFGALALSAHNKSAATPPAAPASAPLEQAPPASEAEPAMTPAAVPASASSSVSSASASLAPVEAHPMPTPPAHEVLPRRAEKHVHAARERPASITKPEHGHAKAVDRTHPAKPVKAAAGPHKKPVAKKAVVKKATAKATSKPAAPKPPARKAKPVPTLDLDALSKFKSSGK